MREILAKRLKGCRKEAGLTQKQVSEHCYDDPVDYIYYESAKTEPTVKVLLQLANLFDVSIDYLLGRTDVKEYDIEYLD